MTDILPMLFGAGLVSIGVLGGAVADRIRGIKLARQARVHTEAPQKLVKETVSRVRDAEIIADGTPAKGVSTMAQEVVTALVQSGFKKPQAQAAVAACTMREQATLESWVAAACRRAARGEVS